MSAAYDFTKSFPHYGGAILAVDVESWDRDQDVRHLSAITLVAPLRKLILT
jgi:hypothetical protein